MKRAGRPPRWPPPREAEDPAPRVGESVLSLSLVPVVDVDSRPMSESWPMEKRSCISRSVSPSSAPSSNCRIRSRCEMPSAGRAMGGTEHSRSLDPRRVSRNRLLLPPNPSRAKGGGDDSSTKWGCVSSSDARSVP
eukprot:scaffold13882_cov31-Tisochrysis_lutea.AAC.6